MCVCVAAIRFRKKTAEWDHTVIISALQLSSQLSSVSTLCQELYIAFLVNKHYQLISSSCAHEFKPRLVTCVADYNHLRRKQFTLQI